MGFSQTFEHLFKDVIQQALTDPRVTSLISLGAQLQANIEQPSLNSQDRASREQGIKDLLLQAINIDSHVKEFPSLAKQAQVSALEARHPERTQQLTGLNWSILKSKGLILGDVGIIAYNEETRQFKPGLTFNPDRQEFLLLPIDPDTLIVGSKHNQPFQMTVDKINTASAKLSENFFVSKSTSPMEEFLHTVVGLDFGKWSRFYKEDTSFDWPQDID
jgi:hypothetical protein